MIKLFARYTSVGMINTAIHWIVFAMSFYLFSLSQAVSNFAGFVVAVTFSFFANAAFTFRAKSTAGRYISYTVFMGALSFVTGMVADMVKLPPVVTLISFSLISLICGFAYSKAVVFRDAK